MLCLLEIRFLPRSLRWGAGAVTEAALERLIRDHGYRESLGRRAYAQAQALWAPSKTEAKFVEVYRRLMLEPI